MSQTPRSILIVKLSSLGDVVHTLPAALALRRAFPQAHLGWAVERAHSTVLANQSWLDEVLVWDRPKLSAWPAFFRQLRRTRWNLAIDFQGLFRSGLVTRASRASRRIGYVPAKELAHLFLTDRIPRATLDRHAVERNLELLAGLEGVPLEPPLDRPYLRGEFPPLVPASVDPSPLTPHPSPLFPLCPSPADIEAVDRWSQEVGWRPEQDRLVLLNPHCRKPANRWQPKRFTALADRLLRLDGVRVALLGGEVARSLCTEIAAPLGAAVWRADGRLSLLGSVELLRRSAALVTGDTGPMHLAVAVGTPVVALFGPAHPVRTGPYASDAIVLNKHLPCSPCYGRTCPLGHAIPPCLDQIPVDEVFQAVRSRLQPWPLGQVA